MLRAQQICCRSYRTRQGLHPLKNLPNAARVDVNCELQSAMNMKINFTERAGVRK